MQSSTTSRRKPALDEAAFERLLAAASVLQEHNDRVQANDPQSTPTATLSEIVDLQAQIQNRKLDLTAAATLVAEQLSKRAAVSGVAVGILERDRMRYISGTGDAASHVGTSFPRGFGLFAECLASGKTQRCAEAEFDTRVPLSLRRRTNIQSFIVAPILNGTTIAGALEIRFAQPGAFQEQDVRTCEMMAALLSEVIAKTPATKVKKPWPRNGQQALEQKEKETPLLEMLSSEFPSDFSSELSSLLETNLHKPAADAEQRIAPDLRSDGHGSGGVPEVVEASGVPESEAKPHSGPNDSPSQISAEDRSNERNGGAGSSATKAGTNNENEHNAAGEGPSAKAACRSCGREFIGQEAFCGNCGIARGPKASDEGYLQHKWATLWYMQEAVKRKGILREPTEPADVPVQKSPLVDDAAKQSKPAHDVLSESDQPRLSAQLKAVSKDSKRGVGSLGQASSPGQASFGDAIAGPPNRETVGVRGFKSTGMESATTEPSLEEEWPAEEEHEVSDISPPRLGERVEAVAPASSSLWVPRLAGLDSSALDDVSEIQPRTQGVPESLSELGEEERSSVTTAATSHLAKPKAWVQEQWNHHRANLYLGCAAVLLVVALFGWGTPAPIAHKDNDPGGPQLTAFDRILIASGLAEAPEAPHVYPGNPDTQVWLDVHTALYYCPGDALYGKTDGGRTASQRSAQQDQFEPATRRACD